VGEEMVVAPEGGWDAVDSVPRVFSHCDAYWKDKLYKTAMERTDAEKLMDAAIAERDALRLELQATKTDLESVLGDKAKMVSRTVAKVKEAQGEIRSLKEQLGVSEVERCALKKELEKVMEEKSKLLATMHEDQTATLLHEQHMGMKNGSLWDEIAVHKARIDELEKQGARVVTNIDSNTASSIAALEGLRLTCAELNREMDVFRQERDAAVASLESCRRERDAAVASLATTTRELQFERSMSFSRSRASTTHDDDMAAIVRQKDQINRMLETKIATLEKQVEEMQKSLQPARGRRT
jgi:hypothetical protein